MNVRDRIRSLVTLAAIAVPSLVVGLAHAEQGTLVLTTGEVLSGDISEVVNGDHIVIKLASGEVRAVAWIALSSLQIGAGGTIQLGGPAPQPQPVPQPQPGPIVYAPGPPPPAYAYAPQPEPPPRFRPRFVIGARLGTLIPGGSLVSNSSSGIGVGLAEFAKPGIGLEGDVGYHFSPSWTLYGFYELGLLAKGSAAGSTGDNPVSNFVGLGVNANTSPRGPLGFFVDIAVGYRWLAFSTELNGVSQRYTVSGFEPLRVGLGMAIVVAPSFRLHVMAQASAGYFSNSSGSTCSTTTSGCLSIPSDDRALHTFTGLTVGGQFDL